MKNKTVIMIAHRLGTVCSAEQIVVMDRGHVAECGTHEELLSHKSVYARMWNKYTTAVEWKIGGIKEAGAYESAQ